MAPIIHAVVDGRGNPWVFMLTGGQVHDSVMMKPALDQLDISESVIWADRAYGSAENRKSISDRGAQYCIPPKERLSKPWK
ncbi:MAG: transposase [Candidatus Ventricola sp.]